MAEVALASEDHRRAETITRRDDLVVAPAAAWLEDRSRPGLDGRFDSVSEGEERVGGEHASLCFVSSLARREVH